MLNPSMIYLLTTPGLCRIDSLIGSMAEGSATLMAPSHVSLTIKPAGQNLNTPITVP